MMTSPKKWLLLDLGLTDYKDAWDLQLRLLEARKDRVLKKDVVLFLEHAPVFTLGRRGGRNNLKVPEDFIASRGIPIVHVERGGDITYHGPGQLVIYPIVDLKEAEWSVVDFVEALEEIMIRTVGDWGIMAERNSLNRGAWVGMSKIGSVGTAVRRSISFHGLALNVNTNLEPFTWIHPCGLQGVAVTSVKKILGQETPMVEVKEKAALHLQEVFRVGLERCSLEQIEHLLIHSNEATHQRAV
jgi:lipoate-protein ligase B